MGSSWNSKKKKKKHLLRRTWNNYSTYSEIIYCKQVYISRCTVFLYKRKHLERFSKNKKQKQNKKSPIWNYFTNTRLVCFHLKRNTVFHFFFFVFVLKFENVDLSCHRNFTSLQRELYNKSKICPFWIQQPLDSTYHQCIDRLATTCLSNSVVTFTLHC